MLEFNLIKNLRLTLKLGDKKIEVGTGEESKGILILNSHSPKAINSKDAKRKS